MYHIFIIYIYPQSYIRSSTLGIMAKIIQMVNVTYKQKSFYFKRVPTKSNVWADKLSRELFLGQIEGWIVDPIKDLIGKDC